MKRKTKVSIAQASEKPVPIDVLADSIVSIARGIRQLQRGPLNDRALMLLIQHAAPQVNLKPISQKEIKAVFAGIDALEAAYIRKRQGKAALSS